MRACIHSILSRARGWFSPLLRFLRDQRVIREKLSMVRTAAKHNYPVSDIDQMLAEIESGYRVNEKDG
jgi:hypothetical protein